jgi:hypothetical protein
MTGLGRKFGIAVGFASLLAVPACKQILGLHERGELVVATRRDGTPDPVQTLVAPALFREGAVRSPTPRRGALTAWIKTAARRRPRAMTIRRRPAFDCLFDCGDDGACRAPRASLQPRQRADRLDGCREKSCAATCGLSCGGFGYVVPGCDSCVRAKCCGRRRRCAKNIDCQKLDLCRTPLPRRFYVLPFGLRRTNSLAEKWTTSRGGSGACRAPARWSASPDTAGNASMRRSGPSRRTSKLHVLDDDRRIFTEKSLRRSGGSRVQEARRCAPRPSTGARRTPTGWFR